MDKEDWKALFSKKQKQVKGVDYGGLGCGMWGVRMK